MVVNVSLDFHLLVLISLDPLHPVQPLKGLQLPKSRPIRPAREHPVHKQPVQPLDPEHVRTQDVDPVIGDHRDCRALYNVAGRLSAAAVRCAGLAGQGGVCRAG